MEKRKYFDSSVIGQHIEKVIVVSPKDVKGSPLPATMTPSEEEPLDYCLFIVHYPTPSTPYSLHPNVAHTSSHTEISALVMQSLLQSKAIIHFFTQKTLQDEISYF